VSEALAPPFLVASLVLCLAGLAKLRAPDTAAAALRISPSLIRGLAVGEFVLGVSCVVQPTRATAVVLAGAYATFAAVAAALRRRGLACGCFGDNDLPVSQAHVIASELLGALAAAAALASPRGLSWVVGQPIAEAVVLAVAIAAAAYATVLIFTVLPRAWNAWSAE
jgi:hypothetical protein